MAHLSKRFRPARSGNVLRDGFREFHSYKNIHTLWSFLPIETLRALIKKHQADKWVHTLFTFPMDPNSDNLIKLHILMHLLKPKHTSLRAIVRCVCIHTNSLTISYLKASLV